jgi:hypothetical protein
LRDGHRLRDLPVLAGLGAASPDGADRAGQALQGGHQGVGDSVRGALVRGGHGRAPSASYWAIPHTIA